MCGIAGFLTQNRESDFQIQDCLVSLGRRGPDHADYFIEYGQGFQLGFLHTRFSIIDLHARSHQPLWSRTRDLAVIFNGEIYNFRELKSELVQMGYVFETQSDTEVLLYAYQAWGLDCFKKMEGFWALALFDKRRHKIIISRDRMGKAPFYYAFHKGQLLWGSNITALFKLCPDFPREVNEAVATRHLIYAAKDVDEQTFFRGVYQLPKASYCEIDCRQGPSQGPLEAVLFYTLRRFQRTEVVDDAEVAEWVDQYWRKFVLAVERRLVSDVPIAFELSGGIDSSSIVAAALELLPLEKIHAFTVKFTKENQDEEPFARAVFEHTGSKIQYHVIHPDNRDILSSMQSSIEWMEEPIFSPGGSGGFTYRHLAEKIAQAGNKVVISGSAGDELFGGYPEEFFYLYVESLLEAGYEDLARQEMLNYSEKDLDIEEILPRIRAIKNYNVPFQKKFAPYIDSNEHVFYNTDDYSFSDKIAHWYTEFKVPYWLRAIDRSLMSIPIEGRYPFLDCEYAAFCLEIPQNLIFRNGWSKWIIRKAIEPKLPHEVVWRKNKMGFPFPIKTFMRQNREYFIDSLNVLEGGSCLNTRDIIRDYDLLTEEVVYGLWRAVNFALWYQVMICQKDIAAVAI